MPLAGWQRRLTTAGTALLCICRRYYVDALIDRRAKAAESLLAACNESWENGDVINDTN